MTKSKSVKKPPASTLIYPKSNIDAAILEKIRKQLPIRLAFDFDGMVERAIRNYLLALHAKKETPPPHEQRESLKGVSVDIKKLQKHFLELNYQEQALLGMDLLDALSEAQRNIKLRSKRPGIKDQSHKPLQFFVQEMYEIYKLTTGHSDKYSKITNENTEATEITGNFPKLLKILFSVLNVKKTDGAIKGYIDKISSKKTS